MKKTIENPVTFQDIKNQQLNKKALIDIFDSMDNVDALEHLLLNTPKVLLAGSSLTLRALMAVAVKWGGMDAASKSSVIDLAFGDPTELTTFMKEGARLLVTHVKFAVTKEENKPDAYEVAVYMNKLTPEKRVEFSIKVVALREKDNKLSELEAQIKVKKTFK